MSNQQRAIRSLEHLQNSASTARVLNLREVAQRMSADPDFMARPMFKNPDLNRAIIVKHRLRSNELEEFTLPRATATKILLPIDHCDLKMGARYLFVGQKGFDELLQETFNIQIGFDSNDYRTLRLLDETPSLDPFLLREQLKRHGLEPARCYFDLSPADTRRMLTFAQHEIEPLIHMSIGQDPAFAARARKLAHMILSNVSSADLDPLRRTLMLEQNQYQEGIFCWKAFLYYKWRLNELLPDVTQVSKQIETVRPRGVVDIDTRTLLVQLRENIRSAFMASLRRVRDTLSVYDRAYQGLTQQQNPIAFRNFLLQAPDLFNELGDRLGAVDHVISFWRFRFPSNRPVMITGDELADIFTDFEFSLNYHDFAAHAAA
ncbi:MAG: hypothetical protein P4L64_14290 [Caulobacteraceae bacterium]|nr:hypothetical protein [Caulobacteraceae bacterium]